MYSFPQATILDIDLESGSIRRNTIPGSVYRLHPGGSSLAAYLLLKRLPRGVDPLSPRNALVFAVSPLTGLPIAGQSRVTVAAKSPLTGGMGDSQAGGFLPAALKANGFDAVVFSGRSEEPVYLYIHGGEAELRPCGSIWGMSTGDGDSAIRSALGDRTLEIAQIGPA